MASIVFIDEITYLLPEALIFEVNVTIASFKTASSVAVPIVVNSISPAI